MLLTVFEIANWFLSMQSMTHKKLQRMCYYAQSWWLANYDEPLFMNRFEAWIHGPVCPDLYFLYKDYGTCPIAQLKNYPSTLDKQTQSFLMKIWDTYHHYADFELDKLTQAEYPWQHARQGLSISEYSRNPISWNDMENYYKRRLKD